MKTQKRVKKTYGWKFICPPNKYSSIEAAEFLGLPLNVIYIMRKKGALPFSESQSMYFYEKKDLLYWIMQNQPEKVNKQNLKKRNLFKLAQHYLNILIMLFK